MFIHASMSKARNSLKGLRAEQSSVCVCECVGVHVSFSVRVCVWLCISMCMYGDTHFDQAT